MSYAVVFHPEAKKEFDAFDASVRRMILKKILKISEDPKIGKPLWNQSGNDLSGYFKAYVDDRRIRIVYRIDGKNVHVFIIAIGKREGFEVYKTAFERK